MSAAQGTMPVFLLDRVTATGASKPYQMAGSGLQNVTVTFTSEGTTSGGTILIEESDLPSYTGTWSQVYSQAASGFTGGAKLAVHVAIGAGMWVRTRVSATITGGGTVTTTLTAG